MTKHTNLNGYLVTETTLDNGWYELSTFVCSMGEQYRERKRYDHKPTEGDYMSFMSHVESTR